MSDLIDRKEALKALREIFTRGNGLRPATVDMINAIKFLPSAEPKTGKWLPDNNNIYEVRFICSECKKSEAVPTIMYKPAWDYCPNCGKKMEVTE